MTKKKTPQPIGETPVGCLYVECHRGEITGPRYAHRGWRTKDFVVNIYHRLHHDFDLLGGYNGFEDSIAADDPLNEPDKTKPRDMLASHISFLASTYCNIFTDFPSEADIREAVRSAYSKMREMEAELAK